MGDGLAGRRAALQDARAAELAERVGDLLAGVTAERALDVGTGAGALAILLASVAREVVAVDLAPELLAEARKRVPANVEVLEADAMRLPFADGAFDLTGTLRTLHHVARPELALAELARVTAPGGTLLVVDQIAPLDPLAAADLNRFERARDASTSRILADVDFRSLFDANGLVLRRVEFQHEPRELEPYLDLAGCEGEARDRARALAPPDYTASLAWYRLERPSE